MIKGAFMFRLPVFKGWTKSFFFFRVHFFFRIEKDLCNNRKM